MKRSKFSLSHYKLMSANMGPLMPIGLVEVLPGDTFQHATSALIRCSALLAPVMHPVEVRIHHWYVPLRLVWDNFESFITGGEQGDDASVFPTITLSYVAEPESGNNHIGMLPDYLGVCPNVNNLVVSALPFRAYTKIYNEWYRDQDLIDPLPLVTTDGNDATTNTTMQNIAWEKDYFTSARPFTQKGPEVTIPFTENAPVVGTGSGPTFSGPFAGPTGIGGNAGSPDVRFTAGNATANAAMNWDDPNLEADLASVSAVNINDLRLAFALQRYQEARARYGSRYTEYLSYLGVRSPDARLQRPEYLGGGKQTIQFSEVLQTAPVADNGNVGDLKGHGIAAMRSNRYRRFFPEHGYVVSLMSIRPRTMYTQGLWRTWRRRTKEDFWQRELQHIGQQEVANQEIWAPAAAPDGVFGYQDRYDEYRRHESSIAGEMRNPALDYWHMARGFASQPVLNESFVTADPTGRIFAVDPTTADSLYIMARHSIQARRLVAKSGKSFIF